MVAAADNATRSERHNSSGLLLNRQGDALMLWRSLQPNCMENNKKTNSTWRKG
eukprot:m.179876 g.179876  ORF g.179876 m.179876 type:complete len:53 (+) comp16604_c4_seq1:1749-1907(+)